MYSRAHTQGLRVRFVRSQRITPLEDYHHSLTFVIRWYMALVQSEPFMADTRLRPVC